MKKALIIVGVLLAVVLGVIAFLRLSSAPSALPDQNTENLRPEFRVRDGQGGMRRYGSSTTQADLEAAIERVVLDRVGPEESARARQAAEVLATRADLLFDPDLERWRERARAAGASLPPVDDAYVRMWEGSVEPYTNPRVDISGIRVEPVDPDRAFPKTQPGTICMRGGSDEFGTGYPDLRVDPAAGDRRETMELFIPVRVRDADGDDLGGTVSLVIGRPAPGEPWRELEMFLYFGSDAFDRDLSIPPY